MASDTKKNHEKSWYGSCSKVISIAERSVDMFVEGSKKSLSTLDSPT
jgi:hypothetical protein